MPGEIFHDEHHLKRLTLSSLDSLRFSQLMYRSPQCALGTFLQGLTETGVGVDNFIKIGERGSHLDSQRHLPYQVTGTWSYHGCAQEDAIIFTGNHQDDAVIGAQGQGASIGGQGEAS